MYLYSVLFPNMYITDAEDIFADTDSIDAIPNRPNVRRSLRYLNSIQISDDEMDAVCILLL